MNVKHVKCWESRREPLWQQTAAHNKLFSGKSMYTISVALIFLMSLCYATRAHQSPVHLLRRTIITERERAWNQQQTNEIAGDGDRGEEKKTTPMRNEMRFTFNASLTMFASQSLLPSLYCSRQNSCSQTLRASKCERLAKYGPNCIYSRQYYIVPLVVVLLQCLIHSRAPFINSISAKYSNVALCVSPFSFRTLEKRDNWTTKL